MSVLDLKRRADVTSKDSLSNRLRSRRFAMFASLAESLPKPVRIVDVGGTVEFWRQRDWIGRDGVEITLVNLEADPSPPAGIRSVVGDATRLDQFADKSFDVAFSNSVIEHLFTFENQMAMAREVRRVARAYWVQTPNFWFPMEPHFHVPGWQWMPVTMRVAMLRRRQCGWRGPCPDREQAEQLVREVRLMTRGEMRRCFPDATIWAERIGGLVKSWVAYGGFPGSGGAANA